MFTKITHPTLVALALLFLSISWSDLAIAEETPEPAAEQAPEPAAEEAPPLEDIPPASPAPTFEDAISFQSAIEIELGLRLFDEGDDYRAITALKRHRLLAATPQADHLTNLLIGDIYRRNQHEELAISHFWQASEVAATFSPRHSLASYHLGLQEVCTTMGAYAFCYPRLQELEESLHEYNEPHLQDLARYHRYFIETVLQSPPQSWESFADPSLERAAQELLSRQELFDRLPLKSPALAGTLSAIIPGAGQLYLGRWVDALLAIGFTGIFAGATAYSHFGLKNIPLTITSGLFTLSFYAGNITNAVVDARRINANRYEDYFQSLHQDLWPRLFLQVQDNQVDYQYRFDWPGILDDQDLSTEPPPIPDLL